MASSTVFFALFLGSFFLKIDSQFADKLCVTCSSFSNMKGPGFAKDILKTHANQFCENHEKASNKSGIRMEICESKNNIYEMKTCGILKGFVNLTTFEKPLSAQIFHRGCITTQPSLLFTCYNIDNNSPEVDQSLKKVFQPIQHYSINSFRGQRCLCKSSSCDVSSATGYHSRFRITTTFLIFFYCVLH